MTENPKTIAGANWPARAAICVACLLSALSAVVVPWQQVHPSDPSLRISLGYAPLWSARFSDLPGAHIDIISAAINILVIWVLLIAIIVVLAAWKSAK